MTILYLACLINDPVIYFFWVRSVIQLVESLPGDVRIVPLAVGENTLGSAFIRPHSVICKECKY